ncbi:hypothetical protein [Marmoricola endophyticus]|nr:hypothetical protein [Marmoricola endophyticus]
MDDTCDFCGHDWHGLTCRHKDIERGLMLRVVPCTCESSLEAAS